MARRNIDSGQAPAPAEVGTMVGKGNKKVEEGAGKEVATGNHNNITIEELFDKMNQELREKRKQAKREGKSEAEIKTIKFDKNSVIYKAWILAFNENQLDLLTKKESKLQAQIEAAEASGKEVSADLFEKWRVTALKIAEVSNAQRSRKNLSNQIDHSLKEITALQDTKAVLGGDNSAIVREIVGLEAGSHVAGVQIDAIDQFTIGDDLQVISETAPGLVADVSIDGGNLVQISGNERRKITEAGMKDIEENNKKKIDEREKRVGSAETAYMFHSILEQTVGEDVIFARLLLKNENFKKAVNNLFDAKVDLVGKSAERVATQLVFLLKDAQGNYNRLKEDIKIMPAVPPEAEEIGEMQAEIKQLQEQLKKTSWLFGGRKKTDLKNKIQALEEKLSGISVNLSEKATELLEQAGVNSNTESFQAVAEQAAELNKSVQSGNISPGSSRFKKHAMVIMAALAGLAITSSVGEVGSRTSREKPHAGSTTTPSKDGFTEAVDTSEMPAVSLLDGGASEPEPAVDDGFTSAGDILTPVQDTTIPAFDTHKLTKPGSKGRGGVKIASVDVGGGGEVAAPATEAVVAPVVASAEAAPKREYTSKELSVQIEEYSGRHTGTMEKGDLTEIGNFTAKELSLLQKLYEASRAKGKKGFDLLDDAKAIFSSLDHTSKPKLVKLNFFIDELQRAKNREKPPSSNAESLKNISEKLEQFSADTPNMTENEIEITNLLYNASKTPGKAGRVLLKQAQDIFSFVKTYPKRAEKFQSFINDLTEAHGDDQHQVPDLVFSK